jgi:hypothetical protein
MFHSFLFFLLTFFRFSIGKLSITFKPLNLEIPLSELCFRKWKLDQWLKLVWDKQDW